MTIKQFKTLLELNRDLSNQLEIMTPEQKASVKGGQVFRNVHKTDLRIADVTSQNPKLNAIVERGEY